MASSPNMYIIMQVLILSVPGESTPLNPLFVAYTKNYKMSDFDTDYCMLLAIYYAI